MGIATDRIRLDERATLFRLGIILLVFPLGLVYVLPTFTTVRQFYAGDRSLWLHFWMIAVALEWLTLFVVVLSVRDKGRSLDLIGFPRSLSRLARLITFTIVLASVCVAVAGAGGPQDFLNRMSAGLRMFIPPSDLWARLLWVFASLTAAICEETLWRGFAITELREKTGSTLAAVLIAGISFVFFHGGFQQGVGVFAYRLAITLLLSVVYLRTGSLKSVIVIHFLMDASALLAIQFD